MRKPVLIVLIIAGAGLIGIQAIRPAVSVSQHAVEVRLPADVHQAVERSCYPCHSNNPKLSWYDRIAPASWLVAKDIREGRGRLNFSTLGAASEAVQRATLFESLNHIRLGAMPLSAYTLVHRSAVVQPSEIAAFESHLQSHLPDFDTSPGAATRSADQRKRFDSDGPTTYAVQDAPNGIALPSDYRDWTVISLTNRFDNRTMRAILTRPDPSSKGTARTDIVKLLWSQKVQADGSIQPGEFQQVDLMTKRADANATKKGWGWARWRGMDLKPYGTGADFADECTGCHAPMKDHDSVFTIPFEELSHSRLPDGLHFMTMSLDRTGAEMSVLLGNREAVAGSPGAVFGLVTWNQVEDPNWFGARMPGDHRSIELVRVGDAAGPAYELLQGDDRGDRKARIAAILAMRAAVLPRF